MGSTVAGCITGAAVALLVVLWHYVAWRELSAHCAELPALSRQVSFSRDTAQKAQNTPYADGVKKNLAVCLLVCRKAAASYNTLRHRPFYRIPATVLGLSPAAAEPEYIKSFAAKRRYG